MPAIDTYSPRKVTDQNRDLLPTTHDPKKRTTYVQITLNEPEIKEAIRNYIRAQIPVNPTDELPVKVIAGRGENGHSAEVTVSIQAHAVASPERPTEPMATFEAAAEDARRRNEENQETTDSSEEMECEDVTAEDIEELISGSQIKDEAEPTQSYMEVENLESEVEAKESIFETEEPTVESPPKKSSLFDAVNKPQADAEAAKAAAAPPEADKVEPEAPEVSLKARSLFDR